MIYEDIKQAGTSFRSNKMRTLLSLLGILIGVSAVILITTLGESATANVQKDIAKEGMDIISVYQGWPEKYKPEMYDPKVGIIAAERIDGIKRVTPVVTITDGVIKSLDRRISSDIQGVKPEFFEMNRLKAVSGTLFPVNHHDYEQDVVILGYKTAQVLFPEGYSTEQKVIISFGNGIIRQYEVSGVLENKGKSIMDDFNNTLYIPYDNYNNRVQKVKTVERWVFQADVPQNSISLTRKLTKWFKLYGHERETYFVVSASSISDMFSSVTKTLKIVLSSIAAISLLVGGIGIMNIMLVSVTERIREIGIRMSLGASPKDIRMLFLIEAVSLTFLGGILGILLGSSTGFIITKFLKWPFSISPVIYFISAGFSIMVGLFFGLYPAIKASKLDPIEALNRE